MVDDLEERLSRYRADLDAAVAADLARRHLANSEAGFHDEDPLLLDTEPEQLVPVKETYVSVDSPPTSEPRNRRRLAMAAAAVVGIIGVAAIAINSMNSDDDVEPAPAVQPTAAPTTVAPTTVAPTTKTVSFPVGSANDIPVTFTAPDDWVVHEGFTAYADGAGVGVLFAGIANIYADGCQWVLLDPPVGPTVDDLVAAWANLPGLNATAAVDVTVDGYAGKQFELVPAYNKSECKEKAGFGRVYALWDTPGLSNEDAPGSFWWFSNLHLQVRVLDVDGTRLVIGATTLSDTSPVNRALDEVLASIQIG